MFKEMMSRMPWEEMITNVTIAVNTMDEPGVSVSQTVLETALYTASKQKSTIDGSSPEVEEEDIDGMGFSGHYLRLLRSNCMKQGVFVEFLDSWLVPWVHFIPITVEAKELREVTRFLIEEPEGQVYR